MDRQAFEVVVRREPAADSRPRSSSSHPPTAVRRADDGQARDRRARGIHLGQEPQADGRRVEAGDRRPRVASPCSAAARRATSRRCCARCASTRCRPRRSPASASASIDSAFNVFDVPFFFESYDELNDVTDKLTPVDPQAHRAEGFRPAQLGPRRVAAGVHEEAGADGRRSKKIKLYTSAGNDRWCSGSRPTASSRARWR